MLIFKNQKNKTYLYLFNTINKSETFYNQFKVQSTFLLNL